MVDPRHRQVPDTEGPAEIASSSRTKVVVAGVLVVALAVLAVYVWRRVGEGRASDRWARLAAIESAREDPSDRAWLATDVRADDTKSRAEHVQKLEAFLAEEGAADAVLAAHVHALIANLEMSQALSLSVAGKSPEVAEHYAKAKQHLETIASEFPKAPMNWDRLKPQDNPSVTRLLLRVAQENRAWEEAHGRKPVEPDADPVVLVRTDQGDLRLRVYAAQSPSLVKSFLDRATRGDLDGTLLFGKREETDEGWVRGGDARTKRADPSMPPTDEERKAWGNPTPADPLAPEEGRNVVAHEKGVVSAWHAAGEEDDDPAQFLIVTRDTPRFDYEYTPFARVEPPSLATLERIASLKTRFEEKREANADPKSIEQFAKPPEIVKVLVYEKGALRAGTDASRADASEKTLAGVLLDAYRKVEKPEPPPVPPTPAPGAMGADEGGTAPSPPAMDGR